jgi:hypothetical protein
MLSFDLPQAERLFISAFSPLARQRIPPLPVSTPGKAFLYCRMAQSPAMPPQFPYYAGYRFRRFTPLSMSTAFTAAG